MEIANETLPKSIEAKEFSALFCRDRHASGTHIVFEWMFRKKRSTGSNKRSGYHPKSVCIGRGRIIFFVISFIAIGYVWIFAQSEKIQCTPNLDENAIVIRSKNMCISNVTTKFGNLALSSMDYRSCHLNIVEYGTEYVRIDYTNKQKQQKFTVFEIVVSPYNLVVISQFDEVGNQINFSTY